MGVRAIIYFEVVTTIALAIGLVAVNVMKPGVGVNLPTGQGSEITAKPQTWDQILLHIVPESVIRAMAEGDVLRFTGSVPPQIYVRGKVEIRGTIDLSAVDMPATIPTTGVLAGQRATTFNARGTPTTRSPVIARSM